MKLFNEQPFVFVYRSYETRLIDPIPKAVSYRHRPLGAGERHYDQLSASGGEKGNENKCGVDRVSSRNVN